MTENVQKTTTFLEGYDCCFRMPCERTQDDVLVGTPPASGKGLSLYVRRSYNDAIWSPYSQSSCELQPRMYG